MMHLSILWTDFLWFWRLRWFSSCLLLPGMQFVELSIPLDGEVSALFKRLTSILTLLLHDLHSVDQSRGLCADGAHSGCINTLALCFIRQHTINEGTSE